MSRRWLLLLLGVAAPPAGLHAQTPDLLRVEALIDRGRFSEARSSLLHWTSRNDARPQPDDVAYALLLRGRLETRADSALAAYLELALGHPSSRHAPAALLRLGQGYFALGQHERAAGYLERLTRDYPAYPGRNLALAWLARAERAGAPQTRAPSEPPSPRPASQPQAAATRQAAQTPANRGLAGASEGSYTIQVAAYRDRESAVALTRALRSRDIPARMVIMPGSSLHLVRAGRFRNAAEAASLLRRVRALVPAAALARDAHREDAASR